MEVAQGHSSWQSIPLSSCGHLQDNDAAFIFTNGHCFSVSLSDHLHSYCLLIKIINNTLVRTYLQKELLIHMRTSVYSYSNVSRRHQHLYYTIDNHIKANADDKSKSKTKIISQNTSYTKKYIFFKVKVFSAHTFLSGSSRNANSARNSKIKLRLCRRRYRLL